MPATPQVDRLGWAAGVAVESFGQRVGLRTSVLEAITDAAERLPPGRPLGAGRVDVLYSLAQGGRGPRPGMRRSHLLYCGEVCVARSLELEAVLDTLESHSRLLVAVRSRRGLFLHAAAVVWRGRAVVLAAEGGSGRTALVAELVRAGARSLSDEYAVIRGDRVVGYPRPQRRSVPVRLVVLGRFRRGASFRAGTLSRGRAVLSLLKHAVAARVAPREVLSALEGLVRSALVVRVKAGHADEAARRILAWMERTA